MDSRTRSHGVLDLHHRRPRLAHRARDRAGRQTVHRWLRTRPAAQPRNPCCRRGAAAFAEPSPRRAPKKLCRVARLALIVVVVQLLHGVLLKRVRRRQPGQQQVRRSASSRARGPLRTAYGASLEGARLLWTRSRSRERSIAAAHSGAPVSDECEFTNLTRIVKLTLGTVLEARSYPALGHAPGLRVDPCPKCTGSALSSIWPIVTSTTAILSNA